MILIRHIVSWNFKAGFTAEENILHAQKMKTSLEGLQEIVPGIISIEVVTDLLPSSNHDVVLYSLFDSTDSLAAYQVHPDHVRVSNWIGTVMQNRVCVDFVKSF